MLNFLALGLLVSFNYFTPTARLGLPEEYPPGYDESVRLIVLHSNSDAFYKYVEGRHKYFAHTDMKVADAIKLFRKQLAQGDFIPVDLVTANRTDFIGGWDGTGIKMNIHYKQTPEQRAGTLLHEVAHKYGWKHKGNEYNQNDNLNSLPYAVGHDFQTYLEFMKTKR